MAETPDDVLRFLRECFQRPPDVLAKHDRRTEREILQSAWVEVWLYIALELSTGQKKDVLFQADRDPASHWQHS